ncbi:hypothetical protein F4803DRAFT_549403 [Xylaria telfairii]|nr:hypothetical protein F4803DRAFT_549403 [Xylaria telfairii]
MDAFGSVVAVVMVTAVSVGSIAEGKCHGSPYKVVTYGLCGGTQDVRGVQKRHKANANGHRLRGAWIPAQPSQSINKLSASNDIHSYEHRTTSAVMSINNGGRRNQMGWLKVPEQVRL